MLPERAQTSARARASQLPRDVSSCRLCSYSALTDSTLSDRGKLTPRHCARPSTPWVSGLLLGFWSWCQSVWWSTAHPILFFPRVSECLRLSCSPCGNSVSFWVEAFYFLFFLFFTYFFFWCWIPLSCWAWSCIHNLRGLWLSLSGSWDYIHVTTCMGFAAVCMWEGPTYPHPMSHTSILMFNT